MTTVAIVGGGFTGSLLALKLSAADLPGLDIKLVERGSPPGKGLAYGACAPFHLLNVPTTRMEVGLTPGFEAWLRERPPFSEWPDLSQSFMPRASFGAYLEERVAEAIAHDGLHVVRGEAVGLTEGAKPKLLLRDGRRIAFDRLVIATGNFPPRPPSGPDPWFYDTPAYISDPWASDALDVIDPSSDVLLIGTGLTAVDIALSLAEAGHRGKIVGLSRRGLLPQAHRPGGAWEPFLREPYPARLSELVQRIRGEVQHAQTVGVPWQRAVDAIRPTVAALWQHFGEAERIRFLRHLRPWWDIHRHRMAPEIATRIEALKGSGQFEARAGRIAGYTPTPEGVKVQWTPRGSAGRAHLTVSHVINCTGPDADIANTGEPLIRDLLRRGYIARDPLGLGIVTRDGRSVDRYGQPVPWLHALGPLTRPAWWEIVAVPEIRLQVDELVTRFRDADEAAQRSPRVLSEAFADLGAGI